LYNIKFIVIQYIKNRFLCTIAFQFSDALLTLILVQVAPSLESVVPVLFMFGKFTVVSKIALKDSSSLLILCVLKCNEEFLQLLNGVKTRF
jgi:hypothetical protein